MFENTSPPDVFALRPPHPTPLRSTKFLILYDNALLLAHGTNLSFCVALIIPPAWWHTICDVCGGVLSLVSSSSPLRSVLVRARKVSCIFEQPASPLKYREQLERRYIHSDQEIDHQKRLPGRLLLLPSLVLFD